MVTGHNGAQRLVDTNEYIGVLRELVQEGHEVSLRVSGSSMHPFLIHARDTVFFSRPEKPLRTGDIVFYQRDSGQFVMHRILRVRGEAYDIVGDAQTEIERGVRREQIFAVITHVRRKGKDVAPGDFWWEFFRLVWPRVLALRPLIIKAYTALREK